MITAYELSPNGKSLRELAFSSSVDGALALVGHRRRRGRIWLEDSLHTAQTLVTIDVSDVPSHGPSGRRMLDVEAWLHTLTDPEALRQHARDLRTLAIVCERLARDADEGGLDLRCRTCGRGGVSGEHPGDVCGPRCRGLLLFGREAPRG